MRYTVEVKTSVKNAYVKPIGDYSQCVLRIGDKRYRCMMEEGVFISELPAGEIEIECYSTLRNRIGPFHFGYPYDDRVSPMCFTIMGAWKSELDNDYFYKPKRVVPFGLEKVVIRF